MKQLKHKLLRKKTIDRVDKALDAPAMANKEGEKIRFLRFPNNLTLKADTTQSLDLFVKIVT